VLDWTKSTVDLEWIPPLKDGGSRIMGYWVEYKEEGTEAWVKVRTLIDSIDSDTYIHTWIDNTTACTHYSAFAVFRPRRMR